MILLRSQVLSNYGDILLAGRNLQFFTSFYKYLIMLVPAAVVAPLFFEARDREIRSERTLSMYICMVLVFGFYTCFSFS